MGIDRSIKGLPTVSASKIKVYRTCARQYQYKYKVAFADRPEDSKNVAALLGTALHKAIEMRYRENKSPTAIFQQVMGDTLDEWEDKRLQIKARDYFPRAMKVGKEILNAFPWTHFNPLDLEYAFTLPFPNPQNPVVNMTGYIDMLDMSGLVADWKSASVAPIQDELDNDPQFIIYYWAYQQIHDVPPWKVIWYHLRTQKEYEANIAHDYEFKLQRLAEDIEAMLINPLYPRRKLDKVCRNECSFYELCYGKPPADIVIDGISGDE